MGFMVAPLSWYRRHRDIKYLKKQFRKRLGYDLNLKSPETFNEKLQWLKLYYQNPLLPQCADKLGLKEYASSKGFEENLPRTLAIFDKTEDTDWDSLPSPSILKTNHDSGSVWSVLDKENINFDELRLNIDMSLRNNFGESTYELYYLKIKRKIFCEELIGDGGDLKDYKVFCFNGIPRFVQVDFDRHSFHTRNFFDLEWRACNFSTSGYPISDENMLAPENFQEMLRISKVLSEEFPFVRVDFYCVQGKIFLGEMTFFPSAGWGAFSDLKWDGIFGTYLELPPKRL